MITLKLQVTDFLSVAVGTQTKKTTTTKMKEEVGSDSERELLSSAGSQPKKELSESLHQLPWGKLSL